MKQEIILKLEKMQKALPLLQNPIKDNRIVNDHTFALRLLNFLNNIEVYDLASEEELEYLKIIARKLLVYQDSTVIEDSEEEAYLNMNSTVIQESYDVLSK